MTVDGEGQQGEFIMMWENTDRGREREREYYVSNWKQLWRETLFGWKLF